MARQPGCYIVPVASGNEIHQGVTIVSQYVVLAERGEHLRNLMPAVDCQYVFSIVSERYSEYQSTKHNCDVAQISFPIRVIVDSLQYGENNVNGQQRIDEPEVSQRNHVVRAAQKILGNGFPIYAFAHQGTEYRQADDLPCQQDEYHPKDFMKMLVRRKSRVHQKIPIDSKEQGHSDD